MLSVKTNMMAVNADRQLKASTDGRAKAAEKLSSGYRINRAADDAAGLAISEKMRRQIRGIRQAADNVSEGIGYVKTADGALDEVQQMLQRINELSVQAANGTNSPQDRYFINQEIQLLKTEMNRVFKETTFNDMQIWDDKPTHYIQVGSHPEQAVSIPRTSDTFTVTNANYDVLAYGSYKINADDSGINITWKGYDGNEYATETIDWDTLKAKNYSFEMSDYFGPADGANKKLYTANGNPAFKHKVSFQPVANATIGDMITCLNGRAFSQNLSASMSGRFENAAGSSVGSYMHCSSTSLSYAAAYASKANGNNDPHNFDGTDDNWIRPSRNSGANTAVTDADGNLTSGPHVTTVAAARSNQEPWVFSYYIDGIGMVQAKSTSASYWASGETAKDDENIWWEWHKYSDGTKRKYAIERGVGGNLSGIMSALTGAKDSGSPGLLTAANGGGSETGGTVELNFSLTADQKFTYAGDQTTQYVGSFSLRFSVSSGDTEQTVLSKVNNALKDATTFDLYSSSASADSSTIWYATPNDHKIDVPEYAGTQRFWVQAGTEAGQHIDILYDTLRVSVLGMTDTNTLTIENAEKAIGEVKDAMAIVSDQRSTFGAYQNRLEHAYQVNKNVEENTQDAESVIRDTDIAKTMVEYANLNIVLQAGTSMLAQANQLPQSILDLLN